MREDLFWLVLQFALGDRGLGLANNDKSRLWYRVVPLFMCLSPHTSSESPECFPDSQITTTKSLFSCFFAQPFPPASECLWEIMAENN